MANARTESSGVLLHYSTPSCYVQALNDERHKWPTKTDDFFPYSNSEWQKKRVLVITYFKVLINLL